ncbi:MAG: carboxypeptidase-like regulatory domain-containing protein, partial [Hymenobacter sp.]|nr:carboxypeptidase-like regulatory domain-containing protein [Hymenobacter sp.]
MTPRLLSPRWLVVPALLSGLTLPAQASPAGPGPSSALFRLARLKPMAELRGRVVDEKGAGLPGVTVLVKGTTVGTTTGNDGSFVLELPATVTNPVLRISFIGYQAQDVEVSSRTEFNLVLKEDAEKLK